MPAPSFADLLAQGLAEAVARQPALKFYDGDITLAQQHAAAAMADAVLQHAAEGIRDTFIDGARGDALTTLLDDHMNLQRHGATAAQVYVRFTRTSGGGGGTIAQGTQVGTAFDNDGKQVVFTTDSAIVVGGAANGPFSVLCTCTETGPGGNVSAGTITQIITSLFDATFTVVNDIEPDSSPADGAGGNNEESDEALRERARAFFTTLHRGTLDALETGAMEIAEVRFARAIEDPVTFEVTVLVSDEDGASTLEMVSDVETELENWRPAGTLVQVIGGQRVEVDMTIAVRLRRGFDLAAYEQTIIDAVTARIGKLKTGETLYIDRVIGAVMAVSPDDIEDVEFPEIVIDGTTVPFGNAYSASSTTTYRAGTITITEL